VPRPSDIAPGGNHHLTYAQLAVEQAFAGHTVRTISRLAWDPEIRRVFFGLTASRRAVLHTDVDARVREAVSVLERLGLVRAVHSSEHRRSYTLTDEGIADLRSREEN
jgi:hypothetical protein